jgi:hypothetical protein
VGQHEKAVAGDGGDDGVVAHPVTETVTVPLHDRPAAGAAPIDLRTTQVWRRSELEVALTAVADAAADLPIVDVPIVDVPVARAAEQTMIIRRPTRRRAFDWHAPIGLAASAGVLAVMLALADWSERHPAPLPVSARPEGTPATEPAAAVAGAPAFVLEALGPRGDQAARPGQAGTERTGRRTAAGRTLARGEGGRAAAKTRARSSGHGARGGRVTPPRPAKDDRDDQDASTYSGGSAIARSSGRARTAALASSAWVDPFASY